MKSGTSHIQGYNAQAFANQDGIILTSSVTNSAGDTNQLDPMIRKLLATADQTGISLTNLQILADAGYWSYQNYLGMLEHPYQFLCSTRHERDVFLIRGSPRTLLDIEDICSGTYQFCPAVLAACGDWFLKNMVTGTEIPSPATVARKIMETKMEPISMKRKYSRRKTIIEPVFGGIKENRGMRKLQRRGLIQCDNEWKLMCTTQNLRTVVARGWWGKLKTVILEKKNHVFGGRLQLFPGLIDLCSRKLSFRGYTLAGKCIFLVRQQPLYPSEICIWITPFPETTKPDARAGPVAVPPFAMSKD